MTHYFTSRTLRTNWFGRLSCTFLWVLATLYFANAQPCPTTPSPGNGPISLADGNTTHAYPSALPTGVTTGSPNATHGALYHSGNKGTATPLTTVTVHPQWSDGTMGWVVINFYYLEIASSGAVINVYNGEGTSTTPIATITSANASTYYRFNHKNNGPITVTMENTATAATGNFDVEVAYMSGEVVATSPFGQEFTYWKHFITPNSQAYIDSRAGSTSTIATGYFDTNKDLVSSELSWCVDYGQSAPRRGNIYPGEMVYYPTARPDINQDGAVTTEDKLKTARLIHILQNAPTPISDPNNFNSVRAAVDDITHWGTGNPTLAAAAIAAIPSLPSPEEPVFSITGPASPVLAGNAQNFVINLTDDGGHPRVFTLKLPASLMLNSVTGAGVTYNSVNQTITFASSPASATVNVTSPTSQTATVGIAYEQSGFWNVNNLIIYEPCDKWNGPSGDFQGFLGLSKAEKPFPFREATGTWDASLPVTLVNFQANAERTLVNLSWATTSEKNSKNFEIQRSANAKDWKNIGFVDIKSVNGNSVSALTYSFADATPLNGLNYYRLKMVDLDASFAYSTIVSVDIKSEMVYVSPNPTSGIIKLSKSNLSEVKKVELVNTNGKLVYSTKQIPAGGIDVKGILGSGAYLIIVNYADGSQSSHKILITD